MKITKDDVGRKVVDGRGSIEIIIVFDENEEYPVFTDAGDYTQNGVFSRIHPTSDSNLVKFLDEE